MKKRQIIQRECLYLGLSTVTKTQPNRFPWLLKKKKIFGCVGKMFFFFTLEGKKIELSDNWTVYSKRILSNVL